VNEEQRRKYYQHDLDAIQAAGDASTLWDEISAEKLVNELWDRGYVILPRTYVGPTGWDPTETWAYQAGIMFALTNVKDFSDKVPDLE